MTRCIPRSLAPKEAKAGERGSAAVKARLATATRAEFQALEKKPFPQPKLKHQVSIYNCNVLCESMQIAGLFAVARGGFCSAPRLEISVKQILNIGNNQMLQEMENPACVQAPAPLPCTSIAAAPRQLRVSGVTGSSLFCSAPQVPGSVPSCFPDGGCRVSPNYTGRSTGTDQGSARLSKGSERFLCTLCH